MIHNIKYECMKCGNVEWYWGFSPPIKYCCGKMERERYPLCFAHKPELIDLAWQPDSDCAVCDLADSCLNFDKET